MMLQLFPGHRFERLVEVSRPITLSVINGYFFKVHEREDLIQVASVVLFQAVNEYSIIEGMSFLQFYYRKLKNEMNMMVRREMALKRTIDAEACSLDEIVLAAGDHIHGESCVLTNPEDVAVVNETFRSYLIQLSPYEEKVFQLFLTGVSLKHIAEKLNSEEIKVRNALYRCHMKLKSTIKGGD